MFSYNITVGERGLNPNPPVYSCLPAGLGSIIIQFIRTPSGRLYVKNIYAFTRAVFAYEEDTWSSRVNKRTPDKCRPGQRQYYNTKIEYT